MVVPQRSVSSLRYTDLDSVIEDVVRLSRQRLESVERRLKAEEAEVSQTLSERNLGWGYRHRGTLYLPFSVWLQYAVKIWARRSCRAGHFTFLVQA